MAYCMEPLLYHREVYTYVLQCFPDSQFVVQYESTDLRSDIRIRGCKLGDFLSQFHARNNIPIPEMKECIFFTIVQENDANARTTFGTNFWVTIHTFQPVSSVDVGNIMERMIQFMNLLEETSPGEYRLKMDGDIPSTWDNNNQIDGVNMRALYTLAHGQTRLNELGLQDNMFESKYLDFKAYLQSNFHFPSSAKIQTFQTYRKLLGELPNIPKTGQVFQGIYARIRFWNDQLANPFADNVQVDQTEIDLYCKIIDAHVADVERFFPMKKIHMLKTARQRAPEPETPPVIVVDAKKIMSTTTHRLSRLHYVSAFPSRSKELEMIAQEVRSRRKPPTL